MSGTYRAELRERQKLAEERRASEALQADAHVVAWREERRRLALRAVPKRSPIRPVLVRDKPLYQVRKVPNPELDDPHLDERERARVQRVIDQPLNETTRIGGFARVKGRTKAQTEAAARYRALWEASIIGGAKATDYSVSRVDTSMGPVSAILDRGVDAREAHAAAVQCLGLIASRLVDLVVCEERSLREVAAMFGYGSSAVRRDALRDRLVAAIDKLVAHFRVAGPERHRLRAEGERPDYVVGVAQRKAASAA